MPFVRQHYFQFGILLLIIPAQYFITYYFNASSSQKILNMLELKSVLTTFKNYLELGFLQTWCNEMCKRIRELSSRMLKTSQFDQNQPDHASKPEVKERIHYFANSPVPRDPRPPHVKYRVGQVIKHKIHGFRGVIIGWDPKTIGPTFWMDEMLKHNKDLLKFPSYAVLIDARDLEKTARLYINESEIEILSGTKILNEDIAEYFESFDGTRYIPRPKIQAIYPHD